MKLTRQKAKATAYCRFWAYLVCPPVRGDTPRVGTDRPSWVPGDAEPEAHERLELDVTGLYGDLPAGMGQLLELSAELVAQAFAAYAEGDWETCDALLAEARTTAGGIFTVLAEHLVSPALPYRVDDPAWDDFLARLAVMALGPTLRSLRSPEPAPPAAEPFNLADELRAMGLM